MPKISYKRIIYYYAIFLLIGLSMQVYILMDLGQRFKVAFFDSVITHLLLTFTSYIIFITLKYYQPSKDNFFYLRLWAFLLAIGNVAIILWVLGSLFGNDPVYAQLLSKSVSLRFCYQILMIAAITLLNWLGYYFLDEQEFENRNQQMEKMAREAELFNLRQQIQPHFLFNSLNSISALATSKPEEARKMINQLSEFLRHTLKKDEQQLVALKDEMPQVYLYLEIEKVRFGNRLQSIVEMHEACGELKLPILVLQPLVENAIKFGLYDTLEPVTIHIKASCSLSLLTISISNPFDPKTAVSEKGTGFGLSSVQRRLYLLYARTDLVQTEIKENIFTIHLNLPQ